LENKVGFAKPRGEDGYGAVRAEKVARGQGKKIG
jgi:hypothetical protein